MIMSAVQTVIFRKKDWTLPDAVGWLKSHRYLGHSPDVKEHTYRFRQLQPREDAAYHSSVLPNGITLVYQEYPTR